MDTDFSEGLIDIDDCPVVGKDSAEMIGGKGWIRDAESGCHEELTDPGHDRDSTHSFSPRQQSPVSSYSYHWISVATLKLKGKSSRRSPRVRDGCASLLYPPIQEWDKPLPFESPANFASNQNVKL